MSRIAAPGPSEIACAAASLRAGRLVATPTETVYGLAADASNPAAVGRLYALKGRPSANPLIAHVLGVTEAERQAEFSPLAHRLADAFWPGPLTLVLTAQAANSVCPIARAGLATVALRAPAHPVMRALLAAFDGALAAPSANRSGGVSPTTAAHVLGDFPAGIDVILDGGPTQIGLESSVVQVDRERIHLLRPGSIPREELEAVASSRLLPPAKAGLVSPGQLASHYAPRTKLRLNAVQRGPDEVLLGFGSIEGDLTLSASGDLQEAAATLFAALRLLDARGADCIAVAPIPDHGIGEAINDRLRRAAAPRP